MKPVVRTATAAAPLKIASLDSWQGAALAVQAVPSGGAEYTIDYSFDDPNDLAAPIAYASMAWELDMTSPMAIGSDEAVTYNMPVSPLWIRCRIINATGAVRATFTQYGIHTRSNIAIPSPAQVQELEGSNFAAMGK